MFLYVQAVTSIMYPVSVPLSACSSKALALHPSPVSLLSEVHGYASQIKINVSQSSRYSHPRI